MHATPLTFRIAAPSDPDVSNVLALVRSAYRGDASRAGWTTEADLLADERIDHAGVLAKIADPNGVILMAHDETGALASCCELLKRPDGKLAYFGLFAVDPTRQAGGIGRQVLAEAERYAKQVFGVERMEMSVIWTRDELIAWYVRRGYTKTEETRPFPYEHLVNGKALRDDLYFSMLVKDL
ncbi:acyl-CoA N-acyltransferase [Emericellopsis atlantica]|uniref:Acyl-CoA N-acyltransferase n=1 Tax=Emericellopsis atlantica TaxID=2614577 RepID=A0A9P7ZNT8_9HYPO|nr:acyl-CoA N-acyltransferase [Emericellopsis atlantica]KAG9255533.1 acyl-CoA N-acyltransferase [Emericellopsis atlantica]